MDGVAAARRVRDILERIDAGKYWLIYKKTDSLLRGPIAAELTAAMGCLGVERAIFVPQNPSRGRVIRDGEYFVDGVRLDRSRHVADFARRPTTSDVLGVLDPTGEAGIVCARPGEPGAERGITIGGAASAGDVAYWAGRREGKMLLAGGADFFTALLRGAGFLAQGGESFRANTKRAAVIFGSASTASRNYVERLSGAGAAICATPILDAGLIAEWQRRAMGELESAGHVFVAARDAVSRERAGEIREMTAELVARVVATGGLETIFIEGGATASAIIQRMKWMRLLVEGQIEPGIVALRPSGLERPVLILKPGTYPWPGGALPGIGAIS
jgi:uncharacterized protein YgbK (DUF1537 family)